MKRYGEFRNGLLEEIGGEWVRHEDLEKSVVSTAYIVQFLTYDRSRWVDKSGYNFDSKVSALRCCEHLRGSSDAEYRVIQRSSLEEEITE